MQCPKCNSNVADHVKFCGVCGTAMTKAFEKSAPSKKKGLWIGIGIGAGACVILGMAIIIIFLLMNDKQEAAKEPLAAAQSAATPEGAAAVTTATVANTGTETGTVPAVPAQKVQLRINQVDTSRYPLLDLYLSATDEKGSKITKLENKGITITDNGKPVSLQNSSLRYMSGGSEPFSMNLLIDVSGSMEGENIERTQEAAADFLDHIPINERNRVGLISFDTNIFVDQDFTSDKQLLKNAIRGLQVDNQTAIYDALSTALIRTSKQEGAKMIIAFTDGMDNSSYTSPEEITELSKKLGIPIYIVALGNEVDLNPLIRICEDTRGKFIRIDSISELFKAYQSIYTQQEEQFKLSVRMTDPATDQSFHDLKLSIHNEQYMGEGMVSYLPDYAIDYSMYRDYSYAGDDSFLFADSASRYLTDDDLRNLSLGELAIARNEIFARHGYSFKRKQFAQYFESKSWYTANPGYDGSDSVLNDVEISNYRLIKAWEAKKKPANT